MRESSANSFFILDKPEAMFSRRALQFLPRSPGKKQKAGIEGILDPFASGVLIAATGYCTRYLSYFHTLPKTYKAILKLGQETDTLDKDGEVIATAEIPPVDDHTILAAQEQFLGKIMQRPPLYSNVRIQGERARISARKKIELIMPEKEVTILDLRISKFDSTRLQIDVTCKAGVYIRSLGRDIAEFLGTKGYLETLRRTAIGNFCVGDTSPETVALCDMLSPDTALYFLPSWECSESDEEKLQHGKNIQATAPNGIYKAMRGPDFMGLIEIIQDMGRVLRLVPLKIPK